MRVRRTLGSYRLVATIAAVTMAGSACLVLAQSTPPPGAPAAQNVDDWLLNGADDRARFRMLQQQFRGFSPSMEEAGRRYAALYDAVSDKNTQLAAYQWEKIRDAITTGYTRRPRRQPNADTKFVQPLYEPVRTELLSNDQARAWAAFDRVRSACMSCHEAEKVAFMNDQPLFRRTAKPKP